MKRLTKAEAQRRHARRRAAERFGCALTDEDMDALVARIQAQGVDRRPLARQSLRLTVWEVDLPNGRIAAAVYDKNRHEIVTFTPLAWWEKGQDDGNSEIGHG